MFSPLYFFFLFVKVSSHEIHVAAIKRWAYLKTTWCQKLSFFIQSDDKNFEGIYFSLTNFCLHFYELHNFYLCLFLVCYRLSNRPLN